MFEIILGLRTVQFPKSQRMVSCSLAKVDTIPENAQLKTTFLFENDRLVQWAFDSKDAHITNI